MPYPVSDLAGYLSGTWRAKRTIEDRLTRKVGAFTGTVTFALDDDAAAPPSAGPQRMTSHEEGTLTMSGLRPVPAYRTHRWTLTGSTAEVFFEDGRRFHALRMDSGADAPSHWCSPDQYSGTFATDSPSAMTWRWDVMGPHKDLTLATELTRTVPVITVSAVQLMTAAGDLVLVRKRGTAAFMQPGGKPENGETPRDAAQRELAEELGLDLPASAFVYQHAWRGLPANESGFELYSENFAVVLPQDAVPRPAAEIADMLVLSPAEQRAAAATGVVVTPKGEQWAVAPLLLERILPGLLRET
jgi:8-oxo-dGTP pyrophosphatase MutT (NUDIX family)